MRRSVKVLVVYIVDHYEMVRFDFTSFVRISCMKDTMLCCIEW